MRLGYACVNLSLGGKMRSLRLATLRERGLAYLQALVDENLALLVAILRWNLAQGISVFRISSDLVPLGSHPEVALEQIRFDPARVAEVRQLARAGRMRLSMHPGQYTLISADGPVWKSSYRDLCYHAEVMERLGLEGDIILHGGGVYGDRAATLRRILTHIDELPESVRRRLRLENDERCWSVSQLLPICEASGLPLVVDNLHHTLNGGAETPLERLPWERILTTWGRLRPKLHYAEQDPGKRPGAHSEYINADRFRAFLTAVPWSDYDVMLECKAKDLALLRLRQELGLIAAGPLPGAGEGSDHQG
ncbi:UV DNA damage repair endonuclease UvsE [Thermogemmatispora tikiterensis]|uniref:UV damage repair endonuclease UvsE n=1 Tax=Thermogemmatispora tikiterensis TaxID=1825093 RepID=A0A328VL13_9CHLR|nr:UV DNA damage repair endonuclease UvsE [Thermogemmatispora tikiterensis]RAQ97551.1 UV damage repair endonuclease UvsE [Thermogemmatispora tikiterensis]